MSKAETTIYRVPAAGGAIEEIDRDTAVKDCSKNEVFNAETVGSMLDGGDTAFSDDFYYNTDPKKLSKWEKKGGLPPVPKAADDDEAGTEFDNAIGLNGPAGVAIDKARTAAKKMKTGTHYFALSDPNDMATVFAVTTSEVKLAIGKKFTEKTLGKMIAAGQAFSDNNGVRYAGSIENLEADIEKRRQNASEAVEEPTEAEAKPTAKKAAKGQETPKDEPLTSPSGLKAGDRVINFVTKAEGVVVEKKGALHVEVPKSKKGSGTKLVDLIEAWEPIPAEAIEKVKPEPPAPVEIKPMTSKQQTRLEKLEKAVVQAQDALENAPMVMGAALNEIRQDKLFRETAKDDGQLCKTFGEYAEYKFGITREYAQNIAQISGFMDIANEALEGGSQLAISVNVANAMVRDTNKIAASLGIGRTEVEVLRPMIVAATALLVDIAPKAEDGSPVISPRLVDSFNSTLRSHIHDGVVEIDGKQMTLAAAKEKGLLNASIREEVLASAAEGIRTNATLIRAEAEAAYDRSNEPVKNGGDKATPEKPQYFTGTPPTLSVDCSKHGTKKIVSIGNGRFQTACKCRWQIDAESGDLVCFEVNGKRVKIAA